MLRFLLCLLCISVVGSACLKSSENRGCPYQPSSYAAPQSEQNALAAHLDSTEPDAVKHSSGFFYKIETQGSGSDSLGLCSEVTVQYVGTLINGTQFDKSDQLKFPLGMFIEGWRRGIPLIKKGGQIRLWIPPSLGYGNQERRNDQGQVVIPANSVLVFNVKLLDYTSTY